MNKRIGNNKVYLLAKEAGLIEFEKFDWNPELGSPTQDSVAKAHKFAQLIALECARLAMTQHTRTSPADYGDMEPYQQGCDDTASTISGLIRKTFGVEE